MYHRIAEESFDPWGLAVAPSHFREHIQWLAANRTVMPLTEFAARHVDRSLPARAVALTFDDGYASTADVAAPLLENAQLPATVFLPADLIEGGTAFWWDELQRLVLENDRDRLALENEEVMLGPKHADDRRWKPDAPPRTPRQAAFQRIWAVLREKPPADLERAMAKLRGQARSTAASDVACPMTATQVRQTVSALIEFGSHALSHPWLPSLSAAEKRREIGDSIARVERLAGRRPETFAYPYGAFDGESERIVRDAGFACSCATLGRSVSPDSPTFALPRIGIGNWTARELARHLGG